MQSLQTSSSIGIFDSGIGGLTVLQEIAKRLPQERLIYLADTAHMPYGNKSKKMIIRHSLECAFFLLQKKIQLLVVACHTASAYALDELQKNLPIPVIGMIEPGFELLMQSTKTKKIAILGTQATIRSHVYQNLIHTHYPEAALFPIACPLLASVIEKKGTAHPSIKILTNRYLSPLKNIPIDTALLACTHYPLIRDVIQQELGPTVQLIDPAQACAMKVENQIRNSLYANRKPLGLFESHSIFDALK